MARKLPPTATSPFSIQQSLDLPALWRQEWPRERFRMSALRLLELEVLAHGHPLRAKLSVDLGVELGHAHCPLRALKVVDHVLDGLNERGRESPTTDVVGLLDVLDRGEVHDLVAAEFRALQVADGAAVAAVRDHQNLRGRREVPAKDERHVVVHEGVDVTVFCEDQILILAILLISEAHAHELSLVVPVPREEEDEHV